MESIQVKNYKSIQNSGKINFCPLTVLLGKNSSGKSSLIRLLPLLKQSLEKESSDTLLWYGDYVDFGDFKNTVINHDANKAIVISFSLFVDENRLYIYYGEKNVKQSLVNIELSIKEKYIDKVSISFHDQNIILKISKYGGVKVSINGDKEIFNNNKLIVNKKNDGIIPTIYEEIKTEKRLKFLRKLTENKKIVDYCNKQIYQKESSGIFRFRFLEDFHTPFLSKDMMLNALKRINKKKFFKLSVENNKFVRLNNYLIATQTNQIIGELNNAIQYDILAMNYLKPLRAMANRYYRIQNININEIDSDGSNLPMIFKNMADDELREFEQWSEKKFGIIFSIQKFEGHVSLIVKRKTGDSEKMNLADTGFGYSQMLPIVMSLWMIHKKNRISGMVKTIIIEQPELHLHPAYQAKMIDVFVNIVSEAEKNNINIKVIFETHSETMINRLGTLISKGLIAPEKVNIIFFDKINNITKIKNKSFNDKGLLTEWPIDFFSAEDDYNVD